MPQIIIVTGLIGAVKSSSCKAYTPEAFHIRGDEIQREATKRAIPFIKEDRFWNWHILRRASDDIEMRQLMHGSLRVVCKGLANWRGPVIIEGCNMCEQWFREPIIEEIKSICQMPDNVPVSMFNLIPTAEQAVANVIERNRSNEVKYRDLGEMKTQVEAAEERTAKEPWVRLNHHKELSEEIGKLLNIPTRFPTKETKAH